METKKSTKEFIEYICSLYGDIYDDRIEDSKPPAAGNSLCEAGADWVPGQLANHKSLIAFQRELKGNGIRLSSGKIRKILISGGCWTTARSREIIALFDHYTKPVFKGGLELSEQASKRRIAEELDISLVTVTINLPYQNVVYNLENRSSNAIRCARYKERKKQVQTSSQNS